MESNTTLTLGSLFDGSGGFPLGGLLCGITPVWASEIEPFPIRVTTKRLPFMKHYGDISQMDGGKIEPVDIITFGSPCTDMSIAGRRAGLDGKQSVLFYQAIRIIQEMRDATHGKYPRYIVWENVPGAFSSNHGEDFKAVLEAVIGIKEPGTQVPMPEKNLWPYRLLFKGSKTGSYLTVEPEKGCTVPVVVWEVTDQDELALDRYEGYPSFYYKTEMTLDVKGIRTGKLRRRRAFVYIMREERPYGVPASSYLSICGQGYRFFGFPVDKLLEACRYSRERMKSHEGR